MAGDIDFAAIVAAARPQLASLLSTWLPGGTRDGAEYVVRNPKRSDTSAGSFKINVRTGKWSDFTTGDEGGDAISLLAFLRDQSQPDAARSLAEEIGLDVADAAAVAARASKTRTAEPTWTPVLPVPADLPKITVDTVTRFAPAGYEFSKAFKYADADNRLLGYVARYDRPANGQAADKQFRPIVYADNGRGRCEWRSQGFPLPRPLYRLPQLAAAPDAPVLVVEGEKSAEAAAELFPGYAITTSPNGSKSARKADWSPVTGRVVVIWPDNDAPGAAYAADVAVMVTRAGARTARIVDLPVGLDEGWDLADSLPDHLTHDDLVARLQPIAAAEKAPNASDERADTWRHPDLSLLGTGRRSAPELPVDLLGPYWTDWTIKRAEAASCPVDYVAASLLAVVSGLLANVRWPLAGSNWTEPPVLWVGKVGGPSIGKSAALDAVAVLIRHLEDRMAAGFEAEVRDYETEKQTAKVAKEAWEVEVKIAVKAGGEAPDMPSEATAPMEPIRPRIRVADATTEKLGALAAGLPRGLLLSRDELAGWLGSFDRYGGGGADRAFAIEMYGGRLFIVDRMKSPEPLRVRHLSVAVLGGVQPDKLDLILDGPDDGLASRILWTWPDVLPDFALCRDRGDNGTAKRALERLADLSMGTDEFGHPEPTRLRLAPAAENVLEEFAREMSRRANEASGVFAGALGKARGHALRLATVLEFLWWCASSAAEPTIISAQAMTASAALLDAYFIPMAERVHGDAAIPKVERAGMALARFLRQHGVATFNARDVRRQIGGALREAKAMEAACEVLVEAGLIRPRFARAGGSGGRPAKLYEVNPAIGGAA